MKNEKGSLKLWDFTTEKVYGDETASRTMTTVDIGDTPEIRITTRRETGSERARAGMTEKGIGGAPATAIMIARATGIQAGLIRNKQSERGKRGEFHAF